MTTGRKDVVFVVHAGLDGPVADGWNVVEGKVLLEHETERFLKRRKVEYELVVRDGVLMLAVGVEGVLKGLYRGKGKLVRPGDEEWDEWFEQGGERKGNGEYQEGKWSWGGSDPKKD